MPHRPPTGSTAFALVATLMSVLVLGGCSPDREEPAAGTAVMTTAASSPATLEPSSPPATLEPSPPPATPEPSPPPTPPFIAAATWGDSDYGVTLEVAPSTSGRQAWGAYDSRAAWQEVLRLVPEADSPGMWEQFDCHWTWARLLEPDKPTWNLEPWRPVVPDERMLAEGCNPGGPEV